MIISKFGGSATANLTALKNIKEIAKNKNRKVLMFSAIGKESINDLKLTDLLISYCKCHNKGKSTEKYRTLILNKFKNLTENLNINLDIEKEFSLCEKKYLNDSAQFNNAYLISRGEYLTAKIMASYLNIKFMPAEELIYFKNGKIDKQRIAKKLCKILSSNKQIITCGFYGIENGKIKLLARGGGDTTGAILSKCIGCTKYEIFTDVNGVYEVNPNICPSNQIYKMNLNQLYSMAKFDAKVVAAPCAKMLKGSDTQIIVRSIINLKNRGTIINNFCESKNNIISYKKHNKKVNIFVKLKNNIEIKIISNNKNFKQKIIKIYKKLYKNA